MIFTKRTVGNFYHGVQFTQCMVQGLLPKSSTNTLFNNRFIIICGPDQMSSLLWFNLLPFSTNTFWPIWNTISFLELLYNFLLYSWYFNEFLYAKARGRWKNIGNYCVLLARKEIQKSKFCNRMRSGIVGRNTLGCNCTPAPIFWRWRIVNYTADFIDYCPRINKGKWEQERRNTKG